MRLGKASAYAVCATVYVASHQDGSPVQGRDIAKHYGIPPEYLLKILQQLVRAGVLISHRGRSGGFTLRKPPSETTLLDIVEAVEGPLGSQLGVTGSIGLDGGAVAKVRTLCDQIASQNRLVLQGATLQQLLD